MSIDSGTLPSDFVGWLMDPQATDGPMGLDEVIHRPAWMASAACRGEPVSTFFVARGGSTARARTLCSSCPVREECLEYALPDEHLVGWFGGTSGRERQRMRRRAVS